MPISGPIKGQSVVDSCGFPRLLVQRVYLERFCTLEKEILSPICRWIDLRSFGNTVFSLLVPRTERNGFPVGQCHPMLSPFRRPLPGFDIACSYPRLRNCCWVAVNFHRIGARNNKKIYFFKTHCFLVFYVQYPHCTPLLVECGRSWYHPRDERLPTFLYSCPSSFLICIVYNFFVVFVKVFLGVKILIA